MGIWIINGQIVDAYNNLETKHIFIENGRIGKIIYATAKPETEGHQVIDASGKLVSAGS